MDILIDIETLPIDATPGMSLSCAPGWEPPPTATEPRKPPRNYKDPDKIAAWEAEEKIRWLAEVAEETERNRQEAVRTWRNSVFAFDRVRIATIGVAFGFAAGPKWRVFRPDSETRSAEKRMIGKALHQLPDTGRIITFGDYDARVIRSRLLAHRMPLGPFAPWRNGEEVKPWERRIVDLQRLCADVLNGSASKIKGISVDRVCAHLGIERADNPISGAEVLDAYVAGRWDDIVAHCAADIRDEWAIWSRLMEAM